MRSPFQSESEAFRTVLLLLVAVIPLVLAAAFGPAWLAFAVLAVLLGAVALRMMQLHARKLRGLEMPLKMAPPHRGPAGERRILVVANDTLGEHALVYEVAGLAGLPGTRVLLLAPAVISGGARVTGAVDGPLGDARERLETALSRVGHRDVVAGEVSQADPLQAVEDAVAEFAPDEVIVATRAEQTADGLQPTLAGLVRERFAVPVRHRVFEPGSAGREPDADTEARYRAESGDAAVRRFGLKVLAGAGILAAVAMSAAALIRTSERQEARAASQTAAALAWKPPVAQVVDLSVAAEYKPGPEGEKHDAFSVTEFTVHAGQPQQLRIDNTDTVPHSITAPEAGINIVVEPGVHTYTLLIGKPGKYVWFCTFVCDEWAMLHPGYMRGTITAV